MICVGWLLLLTAAAVLADLLPLSEGRDPSLVFAVPANLPPQGWGPHPLGTDTSGLDVLAQVIYGARISLTIGVGGTLLAMLIGGTLGIVAGFLRGKVESVIGFVSDVMLSMPPLIVVLAAAALLKPSVMNLTILLGVLFIPSFTRLAKASTLKVASSEYVAAARVVGSRRIRILLREITPGVVPSMLAYAFIVMGILIVLEASVSFLGLGIQRPEPTWGNLLSQGEQVLRTDPHLALVPGCVLFLTILSVNYVGQCLQRKWDL